MNKQETRTGRGVEWTTYTWNPIGGCFHNCRWHMPDGTVAICYAEDVAENVATKAYPRGFQNYYWNPKRLQEPATVQTPSRIFVGSMADVFGSWVPTKDIRDILQVILDNPQHQFQLLTKNPRRAQDFMAYIPDNAWIGVSTPPDEMFGKPLSDHQRRRMFGAALSIMRDLRGSTHTWLSAEPLTFDVTSLEQWDDGSGLPFEWVVIGAASRGRQYFAPDEQIVRSLVSACDASGIPVFYKGNLRVLPWARERWREEQPIYYNETTVRWESR